MAHHFPLRIYYEDTDAGGVVYHANYIKFCERARTELLRETGHTNGSLREELGIIFVARHLEVDYLKPAFLEDELTIVSTVKQVKNTSMIMHQLAKKGDQTIFTMDITLVCVDQKTVRPVKMPPAVTDGFLTYKQG